MKKLIVTVLSGIMLMGFVSCGGGGSKEFKDTKAILDKYEKAVDNAKTCEEVNAANKAYYKDIDQFRKTPKYSGKDQVAYDEKDMMTKEEHDNYTNLWLQVDKKYSAKKKELCK